MGRWKWCPALPSRATPLAVRPARCSSALCGFAGKECARTATPCRTIWRCYQSCAPIFGQLRPADAPKRKLHWKPASMFQGISRTFGEGPKNWVFKLWWSNNTFSFSVMYWLNSGDTSSPNNDWLSFQICRFTSVSKTTPDEPPSVNPSPVTCVVV